MKRVTAKSERNSAYRKCQGNVGEAVEEEEVMIEQNSKIIYISK